MMSGCRRYVAVAVPRNPHEHTHGGVKRKLRLTNWAPFCVLLPETLNCVQLHLNGLSRAQFGKNNFPIRRCWCIVAEDGRLLPMGYPFQVAALDKFVDVERGIFCGLFRALTRDVQPTNVLVRASLRTG